MSERPVGLTMLTGGDPLLAEPEVAALHALQTAGLPVAPLCLVPAAAEEGFYRLNNLPHRLGALFQGLDLKDPDEDDVEELSPQAQRLITTNYLLDEFIDLFYESLKELPEGLLLRRPSGAAGHLAAKGRPALLALKRVWADAWSVGAIMDRLARDGAIALAAKPVVVQGASEETADASLSACASELLGQAVTIWLTPEGSICRVMAPPD